MVFLGHALMDQFMRTRGREKDKRQLQQDPASHDESSGKRKRHGALQDGLYGGFDVPPRTLFSVRTVALLEYVPRTTRAIEKEASQKSKI